MKNILIYGVPIVPNNVLLYTNHADLKNILTRGATAVSEHYII